MKIADILIEKLNRAGSNQLVIFDIDDTLLHTTAKINVVKDGKVIRSLSNQEFNNYKLQPGEEFDFGEFRNAEKFEKESVPIGPMLDQLRTDLSAGHDVVMLTARSDFDNQKAVWRTFKQHGIDINKDVHLYRAGNLPGDDAPAYKKAVHVTNWLNTGRYNKVTMYDDSEKNLTVFKSLQKKFPQVDFEAHHVSEKGETKQLEGWSEKYKRSINCSNPKGFSQKAHCAGRKKDEAINPEIVKKEFKAETEIELPEVGKLKLVAQNISTDYPQQFRVDVIHPDGNKIGYFRFVVHDYEEPRRFQFFAKKKDPYVVGGNVSVWNEYRRKGIASAVYKWIKSMGNDIRPSSTQTDFGKAMWKGFQQKATVENFADGKKPGRKGLAKRSGVNCKASVSTLRNVAKNSSGEKQRMAHWCANMKSGRKKS